MRWLQRLGAESHSLQSGVCACGHRRDALNVAQLFVPPLSEAWLTRVSEVSRAQLGLDHVSGARLARAVAAVSHTYTRERAALSELQGDGSALSARLQFFLPRDLLKVHGPLAELHSVGALPTARRWRVLDLGAGLGSTSLGVARFAAVSGSADGIDVSALDIDGEALELFEALSRNLSALPAAPLSLVTRELSLERLDPRTLGGPYELITIGLALNELAPAAEPEQRIELLLARILQYARLLTEDGCLLILEPALRETSRVLHALRDRLFARGAAPFVFAPCVGAVCCPMLQRERDFCHERLPCALPETLAGLASAAGLRERDLTYSYLTLTQRARSLRELSTHGASYRVVSGQLRSKGKREAWLCGADGAPRAQRLDRHASQQNEAFEAAERGSVISLERVDASPTGALVRIAKDDRVELAQHWTEPPRQ